MQKIKEMSNKDPIRRITITHKNNKMKYVDGLNPPKIVVLFTSSKVLLDIRLSRNFQLPLNVVFPPNISFPSDNY